MPHPAPANPLPPRPRALLRLGFAGRRVLSPAEEQTLDTTLAQMFAVIGRQLAALAPGVPVPAGQEPPVSAFYARQAPLLRLVTGLCEGADTVAARVLERLRIAPDGAGPDGAGDRCIETELAAVLPFDLPSYRASRVPDFHPEFDRQAARCAYVVVADGIYDQPDPDAATSERLALASQRRSRAYRAQSALLLRHADLLVAAADPSAPAKPGGTLETVPAALACDLPVLFINTVRGGVWLIRPAEDLAGALAGPPCTEADLAHLVTAILVGPDLGLAGADQDGRQAHREGLRLLQEYFDGTAAPPGWRHTGERRRTWREWVWERVTRYFADPKAQPPTPPRPRAAWWARAWQWLSGQFAAPVAPRPMPSPPTFKDYRTRATALNYHTAVSTAAPSSSTMSWRSPPWPWPPPVSRCSRSTMAPTGCPGPCWAWRRPSSGCSSSSPATPTAPGMSTGTTVPWTTAIWPSACAHCSSCPRAAPIGPPPPPRPTTPSAASTRAPSTGCVTPSPAASPRPTTRTPAPDPRP